MERIKDSKLILFTVGIELLLKKEREKLTSRQMTHSPYIHTATEYNLQLKRLRINPPKQVKPRYKSLMEIWEI